MRISFIIPVYNCIFVLDDCVSSIRAIAKYCDVPFEIILVDDGSTDGSAMLCDQLGDVVIHQKNAGVSAARNIGLEAANGDYIAFIDADDTMEPQEMAEAIRLAEASCADAVVFGMSFDYYLRGKCYRTDNVVPPLSGVETREKCMEQLVPLFEANVLSPVWNKLLRRQLLEQKKLRFHEDLFLLEDLEFSLRVLGASKTWAFLQKTVYRYYLEEPANHAGNRLKRIENMRPLIDIFDGSLKALGTDWQKQEMQVLCTIYLTLLAQKIADSDATTVKRLCQEFAKWVDEKSCLPQLESNQWAMNLYHGKIGTIIARRAYIGLRHQLAVRIKRVIGDFRKWKIGK